ncbi:MAG: hypothetical protein K0M39_05890 [Rhizobium sp.]|nr:hypothetical protein [Rhizobium sp.]
MPDPTTLSLIALAVSTLSLCLGLYLAWRDRAQLKAKCFPREHDRTDEYSSIFITATNHGRRSVILRWLGGIYADGSKGRIAISTDGVKLQEGEFYETEFGKFDGIMVNGGDMSPLVDIFLEDSAGRHYKIEGGRANTKLISQSKHPLGVRTHG